MVYPDILTGRFVDLRSINLDDTEFSYNIRADKRNRDTVGQLAPSLESQRNFIKWQMQEPNDYYFVVMNKKGERIGLIGIYDIRGSIGEMGREVNFGEPAEIIEAELLISKFCVEFLHLNRICYVIYSNNIHHITELQKRGGQFIKKVVRSEREALYFEQSLNLQNATSRKVEKLLDRLFENQNK